MRSGTLLEEDDQRTSEAGEPGLVVVRVRPDALGTGTTTEFQREDGRALILYSWPEEVRS